MRMTIRAIGLFATVGIIFVGACLLDNLHTKTVTVTKEVIPDGYIKLSECIPLEDAACYFIDGNGYPCFELKDVGNQLDNPDNRSYTYIMEHLEDTTAEIKNNFLDMRQVKGFTINSNGLQLYFEDGTGYYLER